MKYKKFDDVTRAKTQISKTGRDYLPENFDLLKVVDPKWRQVDPSKWRTSSGFDLYAGMPSAHVKLEYSGQGRTLSHQQSCTNDNSTWTLTRNENSPGEDPYALSHPEVAKQLFVRKDL